MKLRLSWAIPVVGMVELATPTALAVDGNSPRTPVTFLNQDCVTVVDRSDDPYVRLDLGLPNEDLDLTVDELPDSRTIQLVALCRDHAPSDPLPTWITRDDAERALAREIIDALPETADILDEAPDWAGCAFLINHPEDRIPITCDAVGDGAMWDTSDVPAGNYVIRGHTFHPPGNLWTRRLGFVRVVDGDADGTPAGATLMSPARDAVGYETTPYGIRGCVSGPPGTSVRVQWARNNEPDLDDPGVWTTLQTLEQSQGEFEAVLEPSNEIVQQALVMRAVAQAPGQPAWTSFAPGLLLVFPGDGEPDDPPPEGANVCPAPQLEGGACGCRSSSPHGSMLAVLVVLGFRRRASRR